MSLARWRRRTCAALAPLSVVLATACTTDSRIPVEPRATVALPRHGGGGPLAQSFFPASGVATILTPTGSMTLNTVARTLRFGSGVQVRLTTEATDSLRARFNAILAADAAADLASQIPPPSTPGTKCTPGTYCPPEVSDPNALRPTNGATLLSSGSSQTIGVGRGADYPWSCREISLTMAEIMPHYRRARETYTRLMHQAGEAAAKEALRIATGGVLTWPGMQRQIANVSLQVATADYMFHLTRLGFLGTLFNANMCLYRAWDAAPAQHQSPPAGASDYTGGTNAGGGGLTVCYWEVTWVNGVEAARHFLGCRESQTL